MYSHVFVQDAARGEVSTFQWLLGLVDLGGTQSFGEGEQKDGG